MVSRSYCSIVIVTIFLFIFPHHVNTSPPNKERKLDLDNIVNPITNKHLCDNYYSNSYLCDPNQYIPYNEKQNIDNIIQLASKSPLISCPFTNINGIEFGVIIISSFNDHYSNKYNIYDDNNNIADISQFYAKLIHEKWEIGNAECNNGIVIFLNVNDRYLYISTSTHMKQYISDNYINNILTPQLKTYLINNEYSKCIIKIIEDITDIAQQQTVHNQQTMHADTSSNTANPDQDRYQNSSWFNRMMQAIGVVMLIGVVITIFILICVYRCCRDNCCNGNRANYANEGQQPNYYANRDRARYQQPLQPGASASSNIYNINRQSGGYPNLHHRRNVYNIQHSSTHHQRQTQLERERRERERRERVEREKREQVERERERERRQRDLERKLKANKQSRTTFGGGGGGSWSDNKNDNTKQQGIAPDVSNGSGGGGGTSWNYPQQQFKENKQKSASQKNKKTTHKRTQNGGGGGGSW